MSTVKKDGDTQQRLLNSACEVFAEKGYSDATIADICERAGANIAAVNYYFRSKENLYAEAWRTAFHRSLAAHPLDGGVPATAPVEQRLAGRILAIVRRIADPQSKEFDIVQKELANPTGLLAEVMRESIEPIRQSFAAMVRELLGSKASEQQVQLCQRSVHALCFDLMIRERRRKSFAKVIKAPCAPPLNADVETIAEHATRFALAGLREIRRQIESGELDDA